MPRKMQSYSAEDLKIPVPAALGTSTPSSYEFIINKVREYAAANNLKIVEEKYTASTDLSFASGVYVLSPMTPLPFDDSRYSMVFTWGSSYTKILKFHCGVGVRFSLSPFADNYVVPKTSLEFAKRYKSTPDVVTENMIKDHLSKAISTYKTTVDQLTQMGNVSMDQIQVYNSVAKLYFEDFISNHQLTLIKQRVNHLDSSLTFRAFAASLSSTMYELHPKFWLQTQAEVFDQVYKQSLLLPTLVMAGETYLEKIQEPVPYVDPAQLNLIDAIEEITAEQPKEEEITETEVTVSEEFTSDIKVTEEHPVMPEPTSLGDDLDIDVTSDDSNEKYFDFDL